MSRSSHAAARPSILLSQNFLRRPALVSALLDRCDITAEDVVYEIGPGTGILTRQLGLRARRVVAIEKDSRLADRLRCAFAATPNVTIHQGDFLDHPLPRTPYKVVANIPFNITAAIVHRLTEAPNPPRDAYLTMQCEAAEALLGAPHESLRSVLLKPWFEVAIAHAFRRWDFTPAPRVDVVMLRLRKRGPPLISSGDRQGFRDFVTHVFTSRQPRPGAALRGVFTHRQLQQMTRELGICLDATPTAIAFEQWLRLFAYFKVAGDARALAVIAGSEDRLLRQLARVEKVHRTRAGRAGLRPQ